MAFSTTSEDGDVLSEINITPLVDVMLVLVVTLGCVRECLPMRRSGRLVPALSVARLLSHATTGGTPRNRRRSLESVPPARHASRHRTTRMDWQSGNAQ
jgi:hypothetical protein